MLFRHHTDTTITPDTLFEAKGPFEDSRIFKIFEISGIIYRKSYSNENHRFFNRNLYGLSLNIAYVNRPSSDTVTAGQFAPLGGLPSRAPQSCLYKAGFGCTRHHESIGFLIELFVKK